MSTDATAQPGSAAARRALPDLVDIAQAAAEKYDVCRRPVAMRVLDPHTGAITYEGAPCKSTVESVCPACAKNARALRMTQCREGWHRDTEPVDPNPAPTAAQIDVLSARADLVDAYRTAKGEGDTESADAIREVIRDLDVELRESGLRGRLPDPDTTARPRRKRSTRRRQDAPDLPRNKVTKRTIGQVYAGKHCPGMFITLTLPSYGRINRVGAKTPDGKVCSDGSPVHPDSYDYPRAARDTVHCAALFDRWVQNMRRALGYDMQYFAVVEPQKRGAPHLHILTRGAISRDLVRLVTAATYHQVWWPHFDHAVYTDDAMPVFDGGTFLDPRTRRPLPSFDDALDVIGTCDDIDPAHTLRFGVQVDPRDIRGIVPGDDANKTIHYVTKYLTKSIGEVLDTDSARTAAHYERLHAELKITPCSPRCGVWLRYGIVPRGASDKTVPGRCRGKAHRRATLGLPGRRVLVSRRWTGKTLPDHRSDRAEFVRQLLAQVGILTPDTSHLQIRPVDPGDWERPLREHLIMGAIAKRSAWRAQYLQAKIAVDELGAQQNSPTLDAA
ncbi:replication initiator protein [Nocardia otitidiscaviarum]|uniref:Replication initiator protein n=1 Tax=Nocardia otitidiscaviarum TaxID=1823 RepID=A0A516NJ00_9NOCA|nr:replication initiator [Nocardia otitidiscaviarum]MCP9619687.1 helitron helicase-like domain-containing protein [Nocardia otitidiscaviarum]QDP78871.1 replication initiator protein [Nocardia otitidiscaviarum]